MLRSVDRCRQREKLLERELEKLAGSNWQVRALSLPAHSREANYPFALAPLYPILMQANLEIASAGISSPLPSRTNTSLFSPPKQHVSPTLADGNLNSKASVETTMAHVEQVRLLVLGMEERLRTREEKLVKTMEKADQESHRYEVLSKDALRTKS